MTSSHTPRRIACLQPSATVILHTIGELDRVVACTRYCTDVVREVANGSRKILADSWTADATEIIAAEPDLVIAAVPYQVEAIGEILKAGARFLGLAPKSLADIYTDIATIAGTVGRADRGEEVISQMRGRIEQTRAQASGSVRLRVYCEEWGNPLITSQAWVAELVEAAGGEFLTAPARQITVEEILQLDPEVIIAAWCGAGDRVPLEKIVARRGWEQTRAVENQRVYCISDEILNTPAPTLLQGLDALAYAIHPEIFAHPRGIRQITAIRSAQVVENGPVS
jgi:iron complex transport system substrate-binding protein